jgi:hypothetical protein
MRVPMPRIYPVDSFVPGSGPWSGAEWRYEGGLGTAEAPTMTMTRPPVQPLLRSAQEAVEAPLTQLQNQLQRDV